MHAGREVGGWRTEGGGAASVLAGWSRAPSAWHGRGWLRLNVLGGGGGRRLVGAIWQHSNILCDVVFRPTLSDPVGFTTIAAGLPPPMKWPAEERRWLFD